MLRCMRYSLQLGGNHEDVLMRLANEIVPALRCGSALLPTLRFWPMNTSSCRLAGRQQQTFQAAASQAHTHQCTPAPNQQGGRLLATDRPLRTKVEADIQTR